MNGALRAFSAGLLAAVPAGFQREPVESSWISFEAAANGLPGTIVILEECLLSLQGGNQSAAKLIAQKAADLTFCAELIAASNGVASVQASLQNGALKPYAALALTHIVLHPDYTQWVLLQVAHPLHGAQPAMQVIKPGQLFQDLSPLLAEPDMHLSLVCAANKAVDKLVKSDRREEGRKKFVKDVVFILSELSRSEHLEVRSSAPQLLATIVQSDGLIILFNHHDNLQVRLLAILATGGVNANFRLVAEEAITILSHLFWDEGYTIPEEPEIDMGNGLYMISSGYHVMGSIGRYGQKALLADLEAEDSPVYVKEQVLLALEHVHARTPDRDLGVNELLLNTLIRGRDESLQIRAARLLSTLIKLRKPVHGTLVNHLIESLIPFLHSEPSPRVKAAGLDVLVSIAENQTGESDIGKLILTAGGLGLLREEVQALASSVKAVRIVLQVENFAEHVASDLTRDPGHLRAAQELIRLPETEFGRIAMLAHIEPLSDALLGTKEPEVRRALVQAFAKIITLGNWAEVLESKKLSIQILVALLEAENPIAQAHVLEALVRITESDDGCKEVKGAGGIPLLLQLSAREIPYVSILARKAFDNMGVSGRLDEAVAAAVEPSAESPDLARILDALSAGGCNLRECELAVPESAQNVATIISAVWEADAVGLLGALAAKRSKYQSLANQLLNAMLAQQDFPLFESRDNIYPAAQLARLDLFRPLVNCLDLQAYIPSAVGQYGSYMHKMLIGEHISAKDAAMTALVNSAKDQRKHKALIAAGAVQALLRRVAAVEEPEDLEVREKALAALRWLNQSVHGHAAIVASVATAFHGLAQRKYGDKHVDQLVKINEIAGVDALVALLAADDHFLDVKATSVLIDMTAEDEGNRQQALNAGVLPRLVHMLLRYSSVDSAARYRALDSQRVALGVLGNLAISTVGRAAIERETGLIERVLLGYLDPRDQRGLQASAAQALSNIVLSPDACQRVIEAHGVDKLLSLTEGSEEVKLQVLWTLANMSLHKEVRPHLMHSIHRLREILTTSQGGRSELAEEIRRRAALTIKNIEGKVSSSLWPSWMQGGDRQPPSGSGAAPG